MNARPETTELAIARAVSKCGGELTWVSGLDWRFALMNGRALDVTARLDPDRDWLHLDAGTGVAGEGPSLWRALTLNAGLSGLAKLVLVRSAIHVRAEVPLERTEAVVSRVVSACGGLKDALAALDGPADGTDRDREDGETLDGAIVAHARASGWNVVERASGSTVVDLSCARRFYQAVIEPCAAGAVLVGADLVRSGGLSDASRRAIATFLLTATAGIRLARASAIEDGDRIGARLEVVFEEPPDAVELHHALSALSVGCSVAGDETRALENEAVAARYLEVRG